MLCSSWVLDGEAVCPHCGGATDAAPAAPPEAEEASPWGAPDGTSTAPVVPGGSFGPQGPVSGPFPADGTGAHGAPGQVVPGYGNPGYGNPGYGNLGYGTPYAVGWNAAPSTNGMAITAFVISLVSVVTAVFCTIPILGAPVGAVLGHVSLRRMAQTGENGRGLALAAVIIGWVATALLVLGIVAVVVFVATAGDSVD